MKLTVVSVGDSAVTINDLDQYSVFEMVEALNNDDVSVLQFQLDEAMTYIVKRNIIRVDID